MDVQGEREWEKFLKEVHKLRKVAAIWCEIRISSFKVLLVICCDVNSTGADPERNKRGGYFGVLTVIRFLLLIQLGVEGEEGGASPPLDPLCSNQFLTILTPLIFSYIIDL